MSSLSIRGALLTGTLAALVWAAPSSVRADDVVEFYHSQLDHYFVTGIPEEITALDQAQGVFAGWARTGFAFKVFNPGDAGLAGSVPICRFYGNPAKGLDSHFYPASPEECQDVLKRFPDDWRLETEALFHIHPVDPLVGTCPAGTQALYRMWNNRADSNHRYTNDRAVVDAMVAKGYVLEGAGDPKLPVVFCSAALPPAPPPTGAPSCTITPSSKLPGVGATVTLTATCLPAPTDYKWVNCVPTGNTCAATAKAVGTQNYTLIASNAAGTGAPATLALDWGAASSAVPNCTLAASSTSVNLGTALTLTGSCNNTPSQFDWLACSPLLTNVCNVLSECSSKNGTCSPIGTQLGQVHYALVARNTAGEGPKKGVNVEWTTSAGGGTPPPPSGPTPTCVITPSPASPAVNTQLTLTAACTNSPTAFTWSNCTSTTNTCTTTETAAVTRNYSVAGSNSAGQGFQTTVSVTWTQPPTAPPVCTLTANTPTPYIGGTVTLTANCTQSPASWQWTGCSSTSKTCVATSSTLGVASYSVTATNALGTSAPAGATVTWGNPPPAGADYCGNTPTLRVDLEWPGTFDTWEYGFGANEVFVGRFTVPPNAAPGNNGLVRAVDHLGLRASRIMTLSPHSCDFRGYSAGVSPQLDPNGVYGPMGFSADQTPRLFFDLVGGSGSPKLVPGRTYFVNIKNVRFDTGEPSCSAATCDIRVSLTAP